LHNREDDRSSMSFSLEMRNPFLDFRIIECGLGLDSSDLLQRGLSKWVLREAMRDILPPTIIDRADKQGFASDEAEWVRRGDLGSEMEAVFRSETLASRPYFNPDALLEMLAAHRVGRDSTFDLWRAYVVERWLRLLIDPVALRPPVMQLPAVRARDRVTRLEDERLLTRGIRAV
jgi:asparagine synthase (glutamine-hydrolysing)